MDFAVLVEKGAETVVTVGVTLVAALCIALAQFSRINGGSLKSVQSYVLFRRVIRWPTILVSFGLYIFALIAVKVRPDVGLGLFLPEHTVSYPWVSACTSGSVARCPTLFFPVSHTARLLRLTSFWGYPQGEDRMCPAALRAYNKGILC